MSRKTNVFAIFTKNGCPFCDNAKKAIKANGDTYNEVNIDKYDAQMRAAHVALLRNYGCTTFPVIFHDGQLVGGFTQLELFYEVERSAIE